MIQARRDFYLAQESIRPERAGELRMEYLQRNSAVVLRVLCEINRRHAAPAKLAVDGVYAVDGNLQSFDRQHRRNIGILVGGRAKMVSAARPVKTSNDRVLA